MDIVSKIKIALIQSGVNTITKLAENCGWSQPNLSAKLKRGNDMSIADLERMAEGMNCELVVEFVPIEKK